MSTLLYTDKDTVATLLSEYNYYCGTPKQLETYLTVISCDVTCIVFQPESLSPVLSALMSHTGSITSLRFLHGTSEVQTSLEELGIVSHRFEHPQIMEVWSVIM